MAWVPVASVALLVLALLYPVLRPRLSRGRRARSAHRGNVVHWYPNYDEDLRYEPLHSEDIVPIRRDSLKRFGYTESSQFAIVPRTFRGRVKGDSKLRLWTSSDEDLRPVWVCAWRQPLDLPLVAEPPLSTVQLSREHLARICSGPVSPIDTAPSSEHAARARVEISPGEWNLEADSGARDNDHDQSTSENEEPLQAGSSALEPLQHMARRKRRRSRKKRP
jgi:hypothetical protein